jgi:hypothetical protein
MPKHHLECVCLAGLTAALVGGSMLGQNSGPSQARDGTSSVRGRDAPGGWGGLAQDLKLVAQFDQDGDRRLNAAERKAAREFLVIEKAEGRGPRRPRGFGRNENQDPPSPGPRLAPADVATFPEAPLYDAKVLRTFFLEFESADWERELTDFYHTDVEVPAQLTVDGRTYQDVGVHFRGASSFFTVGEGRKHSFGLALDFVHADQRLLGHKTVHLLNSHTDPTFLRSALFYHVARHYIPAPQANYARVVVNGESWGVYVNVQPINKDFVQEWFGSSTGARWKVPGSPRGNGGLAYLGDDAAEYKRRYEIKTRDTAEAWADLIQLCRVLNQTPASKLEPALAPLLDLDGALKFLALENVFINNDGYWIRASDYYLCQDEQGRFHVIPYDANETFRTAEGPRWGGGPNVRGVALDPLAGTDDPAKPLLSQLLAVPALKARYLQLVRTMAEEWLDWDKLGPRAAQWQGLIGDDVKTDTRKLYSFDAFANGVSEDSEEQGFRGPRRGISLKNFVEQRRTFLLSHAALQPKAAQPMIQAK